MHLHQRYVEQQRHATCHVYHLPWLLGRHDNINNHISCRLTQGARAGKVCKDVSACSQTTFCSCKCRLNLMRGFDICRSRTDNRAFFGAASFGRKLFGRQTFDLLNTTMLGRHRFFLYFVGRLNGCWPDVIDLK
jgi:hypothetical protein